MARSEAACARLEAKARCKRWKCTVDPALYIIKNALNLSCIHRCSLDNIQDKQTLFTLACNCRRIQNLKIAYPIP